MLNKANNFNIQFAYVYCALKLY